MRRSHLLPWRHIGQLAITGVERTYYEHHFVFTFDDQPFTNQLLRILLSVARFVTQRGKILYQQRSLTMKQRKGG